MAELIVLPEEEDNPQNVALVLTKAEACAILAVFGNGRGPKTTVNCKIFAALEDTFWDDPLHQRWMEQLEDIGSFILEE